MHVRVDAARPGNPAAFSPRNNETGKAGAPHLRSGIAPAVVARGLVPARGTLSYSLAMGITMSQLHFKNFQLLEPEIGELQGGFELLVEGGTVRETSDKPIKSAGADIIDCGGRTLMPGLIDSHVHVTLSEVNLRNLESVPLTLMTARAARLMLGMLKLGFT